MGEEVNFLTNAFTIEDIMSQLENTSEEKTPFDFAFNDANFLNVNQEENKNMMKKESGKETNEDEETENEQGRTQKTKRQRDQSENKKGKTQKTKRQRDQSENKK